MGQDGATGWSLGLDGCQAMGGGTAAGHARGIPEAWALLCQPWKRRQPGQGERLFADWGAQAQEVWVILPEFRSV